MRNIISIFFFNTWFPASSFNVNKGPTRCNNMQTFIHFHVTLHVSGVMHPSSGVLKTVSATSGACHGNGTVTSFHRGLIRTGVSESCGMYWSTFHKTSYTSPDQAKVEGSKGTITMTYTRGSRYSFYTPDDGCVTPETCRVTVQWINVCILLHRVGPLLTLNHDARNHV